MRICFKSGQEIVFDPQGPVAPALCRMYRHLQHVPLPWRDWDSPCYQANILDRLVAAGQALGIAVDAPQCHDQHYLNHLHSLYEQGYDGRAQWLDYHEHIHLCEGRHSGIMLLDHRETAGPLQQPFDLDWLKQGVTRVSAGTVFVQWAELGKTPYRYWRDGEPDSLERLCELAKPWVILRGRMAVALQPVDFMQGLQTEAFDHWWQQRQSHWCRHWNIDAWSLEQQRTVIPVGHIQPDLCDQALQWLGQGDYPTHVRL